MERNLEIIAIIVGVLTLGLLIYTVYDREKQKKKEKEGYMVDISGGFEAPCSDTTETSCMIVS
jgi:hypothetical protein